MCLPGRVLSVNLYISYTLLDLFQYWDDDDDDDDLVFHIPSTLFTSYGDKGRTS